MSEGPRKIDFPKLKNQMMESKSKDILSFENFLNSIAVPQSAEVLNNPKNDFKNQLEDKNSKNAATHLHELDNFNSKEQKCESDVFFNKTTFKTNQSNDQNFINSVDAEKKDNEQIGLEDFEDFEQQNNNEEENNSVSSIFENDGGKFFDEKKKEAEILMKFKSDLHGQEKQIDIQTRNSTENIKECFNIMTEIMKTPEKKMRNLNEDYEFILLDSSLKKNIKICESKYKLKRLSGDLGKLKIPSLSKDHALNLAIKNKVPKSYLKEENDVMFQKEREKLKFYAKQAFNFKNKKGSNFLASSFKNINQNINKYKKSPIVSPNRFDSSKKATQGNLKERRKEFEEFLEDVGFNPSSYLKNNCNVDQNKKFGSLNEV